MSEFVLPAQLHVGLSSGTQASLSTDDTERVEVVSSNMSTELNRHKAREQDRHTGTCTSTGDPRVMMTRLMIFFKFTMIVIR